MRKLYIEPTSRCNLSCLICFRNSWIDETGGDLAPAVFDKIIETLPASVETIFFGGMGEPLVHPEIISLVRQAAATGRRVEMLTNATLLNQTRARLLLAAGLARLWVSLDSLELTDKNKGNHTLSLIQTNLDAFNRERKSLNSGAALGLNFVVMKSNASQLALMPAFAHRYDISEINVSNVLAADKDSVAEILYDKALNEGFGSSRSQVEVEINVPMMDWRQPEVMRGLQGLLASPEARLRLSGQPVIRPVGRCRFIEEDCAFVRHDGQVSPCMALLHSGITYLGARERKVYHHSFGHLPSQGLEAIWQSDEYSRFRERVKKFDFSPCLRCSGCELSEENKTDCFRSPGPACGPCLWAEGLISCP
ncbi:MAG: SPASM domain-containing protein [Candidatus Adiutrix sp.]|jgi:MoaA/NifB/PqqE/SkfB family radical SAM enzyme|nr:SPASM domain-containing protein [Candidatus Adiutrix sp.]